MQVPNVLKARIALFCAVKLRVIVYTIHRKYVYVSIKVLYDNLWEFVLAICQISFKNRTASVHKFK